MAKDPYKLLGLTKSASDAEIRKAYRGLAKKLHPDVNPGDTKAAERFKEISAAYTLLTDKSLKAQYDSGQIDGSGQQQSPFGFGGGGRTQGGYGGSPFSGSPFSGSAFAGGGDMGDILSSLFGVQMGGPSARGGSMGEDPFGGARRAVRPQKGADRRYGLTLSFIDALAGGSQSLRTETGETLRVKIPTGIEAGKVLRLRGKGQPGIHGGPPGDVKVEIKVKPHKYFSRDGNTLRLTLPISLQEAVLGAKVTIPTPHDKNQDQVQLNIPPGSNAGKTLRLKGKGLKGGDMLVSLQIVLDDPEAKALKTWAQKNAAQKDFDPRQGLMS